MKTNVSVTVFDARAERQGVRGGAVPSFLAAALRVAHRNILLASNVALGLAVAAATLLLVVRLHDQALIDAGQVLQSTSLVLADQAERAFEAVDLVETGFLERFQDREMRTPEDFRRRMSEITVHEDLSIRAHGLPQLRAVSLIDADGNIINLSDRWPIPRVNLADRDYFQALKSDPQRVIALGESAAERVDGIPSIFAARKVTGPDGAFLGVILGVMPVSYFQQLYRGVAPGLDGAVSLFRRDGVLLARYPPVDPGFAMPTDRADRFGALGARNVIIRHFSRFDGKDRLASRHALKHYPMFVAASNSIENIVADWREEAIFAVAAAALLEMVIVTTGGLMLRQIRSQQLLSDAHAARIEAEAAQLRAETRLALAQERERTAARVRHQAHHDTLTGLPNRRMLRDRLAEIGWESATRNYLLFVDIDGAKGINDAFGHAAGDAVLIEVARRIAAVVAPESLPARLGGDEFVVLCRALDRGAVGELGERIRQAIDAPFEIAGEARQISASIGIAALNAADGIDLFDAADLAISAAKITIEARRNAEVNRQKMEALGRMMGGVAHEINNMLQPVTLLAQDVIDSDLIAEAGRPHLDIVIDCTQKARQIIGDLLAFSRPTPRSTERLDPVRLLHDTMRLARQAVPPSVTLLVRIEGTPPAVMINRTAFSQIVLNLTTNAVAAMDSVGTLTITLDAEAPGQSDVSAGGPVRWSRLRVIDTGHGMSKATLDRVFEPFFTTRPIGQGTGLGLSVVYGLVHEIGGTITLESEPGRGTVATVWMPGLAESSDPVEVLEHLDPGRVTMEGSMATEL